MTKYTDKSVNTINRYGNGKLTPEEAWKLRGSLHPQAIDIIVNSVPRGSTILELGSGYSSELFSKYFNVYSVEHDIEWVDKIKGVNYIYAPLVKYEAFFNKEELWYDVEVLKSKLPEDYACIIVDGPNGSKFSRYGFVHNLDIFRKRPILFDDIHAVNVYFVMIETMNKWNISSAEICNIPSDKAFGIVNIK